MFWLILMIALSNQSGWTVPKEAYVMAQSELAQSARYFGLDSTQVHWYAPYLGSPYPEYHIQAKHLSEFKRNPNPESYDKRVFFVFPVVSKDSILGSISVGYNPTSHNKYYGGVIEQGGGPKSTKAMQLRRHRGVNELLGLVSFSICPPDWYWVYVDDTGATIVERTLLDASQIRYHDLVIIGTLENKRIRAISIVDSNYTSPYDKRFFDTAQIQVDEILKGPTDLSRVDICFPSEVVQNDAPQPYCRPIIENGDRRIWLLDTRTSSVVRYMYLGSGSKIIDIDLVNQVMQAIAGTTAP